VSTPTDSAYPSLICEPTRTQCDTTSTILVLWTNLGGDIVYNCTCRAGYYSTDTGERDWNIPTCRVCPVYTTSENGATGVGDCFCRPGTFRKDSMSPECFDCLESSQDDTTYYCPGKANKVACPANTSISHWFASTSASCIPDRSMFFGPSPDTESSPLRYRTTCVVRSEHSAWRHTRPHAHTPSRW